MLAPGQKLKLIIIVVDVHLFLWLNYFLPSVLRRTGSADLADATLVVLAQPEAELLREVTVTLESFKKS